MEVQEEGESEPYREHWREYPTYDIKGFCKYLKRQFLKLKLVPTHGDEVRFREDGYDNIAALHRYYGWPDNLKALEDGKSGGYRKEECRRRIEELAWQDDDKLQLTEEEREFCQKWVNEQTLIALCWG